MGEVTIGLWGLKPPPQNFYNYNRIFRLAPPPSLILNRNCVHYDCNVRVSLQILRYSMCKCTIIVCTVHVHRIPGLSWPWLRSQIWLLGKIYLAPLRFTFCNAFWLRRVKSSRGKGGSFPPPPWNFGKLAKDGEQTRPQPAIRIDSRRNL